MLIVVCCCGAGDTRAALKIKRLNAITCRINVILLIPAAEVGGIFRIAAAVVLRMLRIRTQRTAAAWKGPARRRYGFGRRVLLDPIDGCREKVERIQSCTAAAAM